MNSTSNDLDKLLDELEAYMGVMKEDDMQNCFRISAV